MPDRIQILVWREILVMVMQDRNLLFHWLLLHPLYRESGKTLQVSVWRLSCFYLRSDVHRLLVTAIEGGKDVLGP